MESIQTTKTVNSVFQLLKYTFGIVPIVAGFDKFTNLLTEWENYIHPSLLQMFSFTPHTFIMIMGVIEIIAGILVLARPAIGGLIVSGWLVLIAITLLMGGHYLDVAVRDMVMAVGAFSLARLAKVVS